MAEEKMKTNLDRIEKLIMDGNRDVVERVEKKIEETKKGLQQEIKNAEQNIRRELGDKIDRLDKKIDTNTNALLRQPSHA